MRTVAISEGHGSSRRRSATSEQENGQIYDDYHDFVMIYNDLYWFIMIYNDFDNGYNMILFDEL